MTSFDYKPYPLPGDTQRRPRSLLTPGSRFLLRVGLALGAFMIANTVYLLFNRTADAAGWEFFAIGDIAIPKLYQTVVVSHTFVGLGFAGVLAIFAVWHLPAVWRRRGSASIVSGLFMAAVGAVLAVTGLFIMTVAATRHNEWAWWTHVACAALAPIGYTIHRLRSHVPPDRSSLPRFGYAVATMLALMLAGHMVGHRGAVLTAEAERARSSGSDTGPGARNRSAGAHAPSTFLPAAFVPPESPFFPAATTTTTGDHLPARIITRGDVGTPEELKADIERHGFAVDTKVGADTCDRCHQDIVVQWASSAHRFASFNNPFYEATINDMRKNSMGSNEWIDRHLAGVPNAADRVGMIKSKWCSGCHDPALMLPGDMSHEIDRNTPEAQAGLTCLACHNIDHIHNQTGNGNYNIADEQEDPYLFANATEGSWGAYLHDLVIKARPAVHMRQMLKGFFRTGEYCAACHKVNLNVPVNSYRWFRGQNEYDAWHDSGVAHNASRTFYLPPKKRTCQECHMPAEPAPLGDVAAKNGMVKSHRFLAANTALPFIRGDKETIARTEEFLRSDRLTVDIFAVRRGVEEEPVAAVERTALKLVAGEPVQFDVVVRNRNVGHTFPGGTNDSNEGWIEAVVLDEQGKVLAINGQIEEDGHLDSHAHLYKSIMLDERGARISQRNAQDIRVAAFVRVIGPGTADVAHYSFTPGPELDGRSVTLRARLLWRKFDRPYTEFAFAANPEGFRNFVKCPDLPVTEIAADTVTLPVVADRSAAARPADRLAPDDWMRHNDYGIGLFLQDDTRGAYRAFSAVVAAAPERLDGYRNLARVALRDGDLDAAYRHLKECEKLKPGDAQTAWVWGSTLQEDGRYEEAVLAYLRVVEVFPEDRGAWRNMGMSHRLNDNYQLAVDALDRALAIDPEDRIAHYHRMLSLRALGRAAEAEAAEAAYNLYQIDESAQELTKEFRLKNPGINLDTQLVHVHELARPKSAESLASRDEVAKPTDHR